MLSPALGVILRDIGGSGFAVARHGFDVALDRSLPVAGDQSGVDYETLLRVRPTHIMLEWGARELPPKLLSLANQHGWVVRSLPMLTLEEIRTATAALGGVTGRKLEAERMVARMDGAWTAIEGVPERAGRVLTLYSVRPLGAAGPGSFHVQILEALGARTVPEAGSPYIALDGEDLRRLDPDTIVLLAPGAAAERIGDLLAPLRALQLRAVVQDRVIVDRHLENQLPSTAMVGLAERLREAMLTLAPIQIEEAQP